MTLFASTSSWARLWIVRDAASGLRAIVVIDSWARGPAFGGIRRRTYASEAEALADAIELASAMTRKCALANLPAGGGKTVVLDHPEFDVEPGYAALGRAIDQLAGLYVCGPDVGTGPAELDRVRAHTRFVNPLGNDAGAATARGVLAGLRGLSRVVFGDEALAGRRMIVEGLGAVGLALARALIDAGASVAGWDREPAACERAQSIGVELLDATRLWTEPGDVFMPCALGSSLTFERCEAGPWRAICGSANNQIAEPRVEALLHARGIAWAPDEVVSAGAVIEGVHTFMQGEAGRVEAERGIAAIEETCARVIEQARRDDRPSGAIARALAAERLA
ncbi:Glu/Leu/Phe/Val dehydrogenase dimerization domain-containing protein [Nannocystaceae bacterium ST9]